MKNKLLGICVEEMDGWGFQTPLRFTAAMIRLPVFQFRANIYPQYECVAGAIATRKEHPSWSDRKQTFPIHCFWRMGLLKQGFLSGRRFHSDWLNGQDCNAFLSIDWGKWVRNHLHICSSCEDQHVCAALALLCISWCWETKLSGSRGGKERKKTVIAHSTMT